MTFERQMVILLAQLAATLFMVGLIWFVQAVHYPLLARVGRDGFAYYEAAHVRLTTWVVGPPMLVEACTAIAVAWQPPARVWPALSWAGLFLLLMIWGSTVLLQVPRHDALARKFDAHHHHLLVRTNWIRTIAWTIRGGLVIVMAAQVMIGEPTFAS
jgi:hypothetical protein